MNSLGHILTLAIFCALSMSAVAGLTINPWTHSEIANLFPEPPEGWHASSLDLSAAETLTSQFESFANAMLAEPVDVSVRLIASRRYSDEEREFEILIDTENIEVAAQIDAIAAGYETDPALRANLAREGISVVRRADIQGISIDTAPESGRAFKFGSAGVVIVECNYMDCGDDLDQILDGMNFTTVERFIAFDHRRARNGETVGATQ